MTAAVDIGIRIYSDHGGRRNGSPVKFVTVLGTLLYVTVSNRRERETEKKRGNERKRRWRMQRGAHKRRKETAMLARRLFPNNRVGLITFCLWRPATGI